MGSFMSKTKKTAGNAATDVKDDAVDEFNEYTAKAGANVKDLKAQACHAFDDGMDELPELKEKAERFVEEKTRARKVALFVKVDNHDSERAVEILETYKLNHSDFEVIHFDKLDFLPKADYVQSYLREKTGVGKMINQKYGEFQHGKALFPSLK